MHLSDLFLFIDDLLVKSPTVILMQTTIYFYFRINRFISLKDLIFTLTLSKIKLRHIFIIIIIGSISLRNFLILNLKIFMKIITKIKIFRITIFDHNKFFFLFYWAKIIWLRILSITKFGKIWYFLLWPCKII